MASWQQLVEQLLAERGTRLTAYGAMLIANDADAEDLVHDAIIKTFSRRRRIGSVNEAHAYVKTAMRTLAIDKGRAKSTSERTHHRSFERPPAVADLDAGLDVRRALRELAGREQVCVVMRYFDDLTVPQIARELHLADGTVKRYLANARVKLIDLLDVTDDWEQVETIPVIAESEKR